MIVRGKRRTRKINIPDHPCGAPARQWIAGPDVLSQLRAFTETLQPGSRSSLRHRPLDADRLVFVLEGEVTLYERGRYTTLKAGDAVLFPEGVEGGHFLKNQSGRCVRYLAVGLRAQAEIIRGRASSAGSNTYWTP